MISVALIVKNEEKNLRRCLDSLQGLWDQLVIVDTGSTDNTVDIAKEYTQDVFYFEWIDDFSKARNYSFSKCTQPWIFWIDADDVLNTSDISQIKKDVDRADTEGATAVLMPYHYSVVNGKPEATQTRERIIKNGTGAWINRCHEIIPIDFKKCITSEVPVWHLRDAEDLLQDQGRNLRLMQLEVADAPKSFVKIYYLAEAYESCGDTSNAILNYRKSYRLSKNAIYKFKNSINLGKIYSFINYKKALYWFYKSIEATTAYREPYIYIADIFFQRKGFRQAIDYYKLSLDVPIPDLKEIAICKNYYSYYPLSQLARAYFEIEKYGLAEQFLRKAYKINSEPSLLEEIEKCVNKKRETYENPATPPSLNIGSGGKPHLDFISCDKYSLPGVDKTFDMADIPYKNNTVARIYSEHSLEHLPRLKGEEALDEFARVLRPGGELHLKVPDLEACCEQFLKNPNQQETWWLYTLYGIQDYRHREDEPFKDEVNFGQIHYTGFTKRSLSQKLTSRGFVIQDIFEYDGWGTPSIEVIAIYKPLKENAKKVAFINNTLNPKYLSYGDYWLDAFIADPRFDVYELTYSELHRLDSSFDLCFFIESSTSSTFRYDPENIPATAKNKILYTLGEVDPGDFKYFDKVYSNRELPGAVCLPNENHDKQLDIIWENFNSIIDIIVPSYSSLDYLRETIQSVRENTQNYNLIVCNSGPDSEVRSYLEEQDDLTLIDSQERLHFSVSLNRALSHSKNDVVLLNNDVIVSKGWLEPLVLSGFDICNPLSNCDYGWVHSYPLKTDSCKLVPNMHLSQVSLSELYNFKSPHKEIFEKDWVAFYATFIKRSVIESIGELDPDFKSGGEDYDYCRRARAQGFKIGYNYNSFVFHFGGKTRKVSQEENQRRHAEEDSFNIDLQNKKTATTVCIYTGPAYEEWNRNSINTTGIGGSETCAAMLAENLVKAGYLVYLVGDCKNSAGDYSGVTYIHHTDFDRFKKSNYIDYFISSRTLDPLRHSIKNGKNIVWIHDIFIPGLKTIDKDSLDLVDTFIVLSPWHKNFVSDYHNIPLDKLKIIGNGLDVERFEDSPSKDPYKLIYSSSPDRGLDALLEIFSDLKPLYPKLSLDVYYGFDNWEKAIQARNYPEKETRLLEKIKKLLKQEGVTYHGRVSQNVLARAQQSSSFWVYPTQFHETFCITALECMLAGAVPIVTNLAALNTTVPEEAGIRVDNPLQCKDHLIRLLENDITCDRYREFGRNYVLQNCSWEKVMSKWFELFND